MSRSAKALFVLAFVIGVFVLFALPANAWYTKLKPGQRPTHFLLAQLSSEAMIHHQLYNQDAIYKGSNEPDDHGLQDHTASARRSSQSFDAAAKKCAGGDKYWAIRRLARSFHYLQDCGDPTDYLRGGRKTYVRLMAHDMLMQMNRIKGSAQWQGAYNHFYGRVSQMSMQAILNFANQEAHKIGNQINQNYTVWYQRGQRQDEIRQRDGAVQNNLLAAFGLLAACQNRAVELLVSSCRQPKPDPGPPIKAKPRPGYTTEATPRPPVQ